MPRRLSNAERAAQTRLELAGRRAKDAQRQVKLARARLDQAWQEFEFALQDLGRAGEGWTMFVRAKRLMKER